MLLRTQRMWSRDIRVMILTPQSSSHHLTNACWYLYSEPRGKCGYLEMSWDIHNAFTMVHLKHWNFLRYLPQGPNPNQRKRHLTPRPRTGGRVSHGRLKNRFHILLAKCLVDRWHYGVHSGRDVEEQSWKNAFASSGSGANRYTCNGLINTYHKHYVVARFILDRCTRALFFGTLASSTCRSRNDVTLLQLRTYIQ